MLSLGVRGVVYQNSWHTHFFAKIASRLRLVRNVSLSKSPPIMIGLNWASEVRLFPLTYGREVIPWITDCWPEQFDRWGELFQRHRIRVCCISSLDCVRYFSNIYRQIDFIWVPEAVDLSEFDGSRSLKNRLCGVLELGRRWNRCHDAIVGGFSSESELIFDKYFQPGLQLADALSNSKILICFPKSLTSPYPEARLVETMTMRYLEGMASGCVIVGHAPAELIQLFGYNPVIEVDWSDPLSQLCEILREPESFQQLADRNREMARERGGFNSRCRQMLTELEKRGYLVPRGSCVGG